MSAENDNTVDVSATNSQVNTAEPPVPDSESEDDNRLKLDQTYCVHAEFGINQQTMFVRVLTVDTAAGPCLIRPDFIPAEFRKNIEPYHDLTIRSATNHSQAITQMIKLFVRIGDLCVPYYFGLPPDLPPGILVGTAFINDNFRSINPVNLSLIHI